MGSAGLAAFVLPRRTYAADKAPSIVRVRIFSGVELTAADISGVHLDASSPPTAVSAHGAPLTVTVHRTDGSTIERHFAGEIRSSALDGKLALVNNVDLEAYVASVLASEISSSWHAETLKAQAIAIRTYALRRMLRRQSMPYDLVDDTSNQVYHGLDGITPPLSNAALATAGQSLAYQNAPADVWYHSACGGHTAASTEVSGSVAPPYLQGTPDIDDRGRAYCSISPYYTWRNMLTAGALANVVGVDKSTLAGVSITERWPDGRARTVRITTVDGAMRDMDGHLFYARASAVLGYKVVPSALFDLRGDPNAGYVLSGHGVGHGVGMCQWGAEGRARAGIASTAILAAYFPGTSLTPITLSPPTA